MAEQMSDREARVFVVGVVTFFVLVFGSALIFLVQQGQRCEDRGGHWANSGTQVCVDRDGRVLDVG